MTTPTASPTIAYEKQRVAIRYWLLGAGYLKAVEAMEFGESHHTGRRKGGQPEFSHQVAIASWVRTLHGGLLHPEASIVVAFLHDVSEDAGVSDAEIRERWGDPVADAVAAMTKESRGVRRPDQAVFDQIAADPIASIVKPGDRIHNLSTLLGAFTPEKIAAYLGETEEFVLPMIKVARRRFPAQEPVYENAKLMLRSQVELLTAVLAAQPA